MVGPADAKQGRPGSAHANGESVVSVAIYSGGTSASGLTDCQYGLVHDRGLGRIKGGRPEQLHPTGRIGLVLNLGYHCRWRHGPIVDVYRNPLIRAQETIARQVHLAGKKNVSCS